MAKKYKLSLLSVTSPLCSMNKYIDIIISQNTTQFYAQYVQCISQLHVSAHFRPSSGSLKTRYLVFRLPHSLDYKEHSEDGLKLAETCSCEIYCTYCT